jgi:nitrite reductase/ring-hydroxylating ferredoxin subunit
MCLDCLVDGGPGVHFDVPYEGVQLPAFLVRFEGRVYGYLNRCMHVLSELDSGSSLFFDDDGRSLVCSSHGAIYDPATACAPPVRARACSGPR